MFRESNEYNQVLDGGKKLEEKVQDPDCQVLKEKTKVIKQTINTLEIEKGDYNKLTQKRGRNKKEEETSGVMRCKLVGSWSQTKSLDPHKRAMNEIEVKIKGWDTKNKEA